MPHKVILHAEMRATNLNVSHLLKSRLTKHDCVVEATVAAIGGKWKPSLLFHLLSGDKRFSQLQRLIPKASDRMLTRSLRELEADGLIHRAIFAEVPVRVEYGLTQEGRTLVPILNAMSDWGQRRSNA